MSALDPCLVGVYAAGDRALALEADGRFVWSQDKVDRSGTWSSPAPEKVFLHVTSDSTKSAAYDEAWMVERPANGHATALGREVRLIWTDDLEGEYLGRKQETVYRLALGAGNFSYREERGSSWAGVEGRCRRVGKDAIEFIIESASSDSTPKTAVSGQVRGPLHRGDDGRVCAIEYQGLRVERRKQMGNVLPFQRPPDGGEPTQPCPHCGKSMDADAVRCRHCRKAVVPGGEPPPRKTPWWVVVGVIVAILIVLAGILADL